MKSTTYVEFELPPSLPGLTGVPQDKGSDVMTKAKTTVQPPTSASLRLHLEQLRRTAQRGTYTRPPSQTDRLRSQIKTWCESMSPEQRSRRFTTEEIERLAGLVGKHAGRAAHHHIALALRSVGFTPCRDWTVAGRNRRFWKFLGETK